MGFFVSAEVGQTRHLPTSRVQDSLAVHAVGGVNQGTKAFLSMASPHAQVAMDSEAQCRESTQETPIIGRRYNGRTSSKDTCCRNLCLEFSLCLQLAATNVANLHAGNVSRLESDAADCNQSRIVHCTWL